MYNAETDLAVLPSIYGKNRNTFVYHKPIETTFNVGEACPIYCNLLVEPGDTISIDMSSIVKTSTMKYPSNQSLICEIFWFTQTKLNLYNHDKELHGENTTSGWTQEIEYQYPVVEIPTVQSGNAIDTHHILAHLGFPIQVGNYSGTKMGLDMYHDICNEWLRNQTVTPPIIFDKGDSNITYDATSLNGGKLRMASKLPDYFVAGLPEPQKAATPTTLPLGTEANVWGNGLSLGVTDNYSAPQSQSSAHFGLSPYSGNYVDWLSTAYNTNVGRAAGSGWTAPTDAKALGVVGPVVGTNSQGKARSGLYADLTTATAATWNAVRMSAVTQQIYEADAYFGTRVREIIKSRYGVNTTADTAHIPEFLGATRFPLDVWQVPQSSETLVNGTSQTGKGLGELGAYSQTAHVHHAFTKSFDYWSVIMGIAVVRYKHIYAQGLPAQYSKRRRFDFRQPEMEHLGFTATYNREIYMTGNPTVDNGAFNYRPIYQEYRYEPGESTGEFNPSYAQSLDYRSYVDDYDNANGTVGDVPVFSQEWVEENPDWVDRTLVVTHDVADQIQFVGDIKVTKVSTLSQYGLPGLTRF